jgi:hypothetical protein
MVLDTRLEVIDAGQLNWTKVLLLRNNISHFLNAQGLPARLTPKHYSYGLLIDHKHIADPHKRRLTLAKGLAICNYEPEAIAALLDYYLPTGDPFSKDLVYLTKLIKHILEGLKNYRPKPVILEPDPPAH